MRLLRWDEGRDTVDRLLAAKDLQKVSASEEITKILLDGAAKHIKSAELIVDIDPAGSYHLSYDCARKSLAAVLQIQGLRPTTKGGHYVIEQCLKAQLKDSGRALIGKFSVMRRVRNDSEYPDSTADEVLAADAKEQIHDAQQILDFAIKLVEVMPVYGK